LENKCVADVSCDIDGPVACTLRPSTIANPFYGYDPQSQKEVDFHYEKSDWSNGSRQFTL
jgi:hypothetical protein